MKKFFVSVFSVFTLHLLFAQALVNNNGATITVKDGGFMIIKTNSLVNSNNGTSIISNEGTIVVEGSIQNDGQINGSGDTIRLFGDWKNNSIYTGNNSWVDMFGGDQLITGNAATPFDNLNLSGGLNVKRQTINASTAETLALNDAELATDANEMLVINPSISAITRNTGFVSSTNPGKLSWNTNSASDYLFPLGSPSYLNGPSIYRPVQLTPATGGANTYSAALVKGNATTDGFPTDQVDDSLCAINPNFYHRLYHGTGTDPVALAMFYDPAADQTWTDQGHWENSKWNYISPATTGSALNLNSVTIQGVSDFSTEPFALARKRYTVDAGPAATINQGGSVTLTPTISTSNYDSAIWTPSSGLSCDNCAKPVASPENSTTYTLTVIDGKCSVSDDVVVTVVSTELLVPTAFSPNKDNENDYFHVLNHNLDKIDLQVFNRWGEKVYETTSIDDKGWDGTYKDILQGLGVYVWQCQYRFSGTTKILTAKGNVTLVR